nr:hypothetical protein PsAHV6-048 [Psittacid alphaherpesvirus 6]
MDLPANTRIRTTTPKVENSYTLLYLTTEHDWTLSPLSFRRLPAIRLLRHDRCGRTRIFHP